MLGAEALIEGVPQQSGVHQPGAEDRVTLGETSSNGTFFPAFFPAECLALFWYIFSFSLLLITFAIFFFTILKPNFSSSLYKEKSERA